MRGVNRLYQEYITTLAKLMETSPLRENYKKTMERYNLSKQTFRRLLWKIQQYTEDAGRIVIETGFDLTILLTLIKLLQRLHLNITIDDFDGILKQRLDYAREVLQNISRPRIKWHYDQIPCTIESTINIAEKLFRDGVNEDSSLICLGDDDFVSLALGILCNAEICVIDIDEEILTCIRNIAKKEELRIQTMKHDLREELPRKLQDKFDAFICGPPWSVQGTRLFIAQGAISLKKEPDVAGYVFMSPTFSSEERLQIEKEILRMGFHIYEILRSFKVYFTAQEKVFTSRIESIIKRFKDFPYQTSDLYVLRLSDLRFKENMKSSPFRLPTKNIYDYALIKFKM